MSIMELLEVDYERLQNIYEAYNTNEDEIKKNVEILKEWLKKQAHLPQELPYDGFLEQMLKNSKYRIERTKERIDNYFTLKTLNLDVYKALSTENSIFPTQTSVGIGISPIFLENNQNISFVHVKSSDPESFNFDHYLELCVAFCEIYLRYNNGSSIRFVIDGKNFSLGHFKKVNFIKYRNLIKIFLDGYGFRISGLHLINLPSYCNPIVTLLKSIISAKMISRIKIHDSLESLHSEIPKEVLPKDLGGTASYTLQDIADTGNLVLQNQKSFVIDSVNYVSNEKLRIGKSKYSDDMFGVDGNFKQINLD